VSKKGIAAALKGLKLNLTTTHGLMPCKLSLIL
jgi:hypothetical protein